MKTSRLIEGLVFVGTTLTIVACATAPAPTHRWASSEEVDRARYAQDHARCQAEANLAVTATELNTNSTEFSAYKACMTSSGYVLTAYND